MSEWPCGGRMNYAPDRRFKATVVFVHNFGGNRSSTKYHQDFVSQLGFNHFSFNLSAMASPREGWRSVKEQAAVALREGVVERWTRELEWVLESVEGPKILYSFSFPSVSLPSLLARSPRRDVTGWVCDGGPFIEGWGCMWNFFTYYQPVQNLAMRALLTQYSYFVLGGPRFSRLARKWMKKFPPAMPIFSVRSEGDRLVPLRAIDKFFSFNKRINLQELTVAGDHLEGLKSDSEKYRREVGAFLTKIAK